MSNFDHEIDDGLEEALKERSVYAMHSAWEFNGRVWWDGTQFIEQVWRHHQIADTVAAPSLRELMEAVNDRWGYD